jgi:2'-5' RNA ligase
MAEIGESALAIFPPAEIMQNINRWRQIYDPYVDIIPPHITVVYPLGISPQAWTEVRPIFLQIVGQFQPFKVKINTLNSFLTPQIVLWLQPENSEVISDLHLVIEERFPGYIHRDALPFVPHMTLGFFASPKKLEQAQRKICKELKPMEFTVDELIYAALGEDKRWKLVDHLPLGTSEEKTT